MQLQLLIFAQVHLIWNARLHSLKTQQIRLGVLPSQSNASNGTMVPQRAWRDYCRDVNVDGALVVKVHQRSYHLCCSTLIQHNRQSLHRRLYSFLFTYHNVRATMNVWSESMRCTHHLKHYSNRSQSASIMLKLVHSESGTSALLMNSSKDLPMYSRTDR